ncbi:MAG: ABC transporter substrate-binding protein [Eubacteriales bacterium]
MKHFKRVLSLGLVCALSFTMVACGSSDSTTGTETPSTDTATETTEAATEDTNTESSESGIVEITGDTFKIGGIGPTTGGAAVYGQAVMNGAQIAVDEINAAGGINGAMIEFNFQDDEHDAEKAVNAYNSLKDWGMEILLGTVTSAPSTAVAAETANDGYFMLTPSGSSTAIIEGRTNVFQVCFTDPNQGIGAAQYIGQNNIASSVAVIYDSSDVYSTGIYEKFAEEANNQSFTIAAAEAFTADSKTDFSVQLQKAKEVGARLVFLPIYATEASLILTQAASMDLDVIFFGCDGLDGILGVENFEAELAEGVILLTPFVADAEDASTISFVSTYKELFNGETPNQFAADAYDGIYIIKAAIEQAGVTSDMDVADMGSALVAAMTELSFDGLTGESMTWSSTGEVAKAPKAMVIEDGVYVSLD